MRFAYHNHYAEFGAINGVLPYDELLKHTDPAKVSFELDCGWVVVGGQDPVHYLKQYPTRIVMLHVKDFKDNKPPSVELGTGSIDYTPIFAAAAATGHIRHAFVEQEEFQGPIMEALAVDAKYMKRFHPGQLGCGDRRFMDFLPGKPTAQSLSGPINCETALMANQF